MQTRIRNRVRALRGERQITQAELARMATVSRQTLSDIEQDDGYEPQAGVIRRLSDALGDPGLFWWERSDMATTDTARQPSEARP